MEITFFNNYTTHDLMVTILLLAIAGAFCFVFIKKPKKNTEETVLSLFHATFDFTFAASMVIAALLKPAILFNTGELLAPLVLGGTSLAVRSYFRIKQVFDTDDLPSDKARHEKQD